MVYFLKNRAKEPEKWFRLPKGQTVKFGRDPVCELIFSADQSVSRKHASLELLNDKTLAVTDLGSSMGTFVNGRRLNRNERVIINLNDVIRFANSEFEFCDVPIVISSSGLSNSPDKHGGSKPRFTNLCQLAGITIHNDANLTRSVTHLIIQKDGWTATPKVLQAFLLGLEIVTFAWLEAFVRTLDGIPKPSEYRPGPFKKAGFSERFDMFASQALHSSEARFEANFESKMNSTLFKGMSFIVEDETKSELDKNLLLLGGATEFLRANESIPPPSSGENSTGKFIVLASSPIEKLRKENPKLAKYPAIDRDRLVASILSGQVPMLFPPEPASSPSEQSFIQPHQASKTPSNSDRKTHGMELESSKERSSDGKSSGKITAFLVPALPNKGKRSGDASVSSLGAEQVSRNDESTNSGEPKKNEPNPNVAISPEGPPTKPPKPYLESTTTTPSSNGKRSDQISSAKSKLTESTTSSANSRSVSPETLSSTHASKAEANSRSASPVPMASVEEKKKDEGVFHPSITKSKVKLTYEPVPLEESEPEDSLKRAARRSEATMKSPASASVPATSPEPKLLSAQFSTKKSENKSDTKSKSKSSSTK